MGLFLPKIPPVGDLAVGPGARYVQPIRKDEYLVDQFAVLPVTFELVPHCIGDGALAMELAIFEVSFVNCSCEVGAENGSLEVTENIP